MGPGLMPMEFAPADLRSAPRNAWKRKSRRGKEGIEMISQERSCVQTIALICADYSALA
jgi:hypothetical protein